MWGVHWWVNYKQDLVERLGGLGRGLEALAGGQAELKEGQKEATLSREELRDVSGCCH